MASDDAKPSFTLTYKKPTAKKIEYEDEDEDDDYEDEVDYIDPETGCGGFGFEQASTKKNTAVAAANGRVAPPCCQVVNCGVDLTNERYYRRHKVCQVHAKAPVVIVAGAQQRFCQQCSRFHELTEFDKAKRSCRRRLAGHNERRRKHSSETQKEASSFSGPSPKLKEIQQKQANERGSALPEKPSSFKHVRIR